MRNEANPGRSDPLMIIDPITFIADGEPMTDLSELHKSGGCVETSCTADDGEHSIPPIYYWEEPRVRNTADVDKEQEDNDDGSSMPWWVIVIIACCCCCCCIAILFLVLRRRRKDRPHYKEVKEIIDAANPDQHTMQKTLPAAGHYSRLKETEMDDMESPSATPSKREQAAGGITTTAVPLAAAPRKQKTPPGISTSFPGSEDQSIDALLGLPPRPVRRSSAVVDGTALVRSASASGRERKGGTPRTRRNPLDASAGNTAASFSGPGSRAAITPRQATRRPASYSPTHTGQLGADAADPRTPAGFTRLPPAIPNSPATPSSNREADWGLMKRRYGQVVEAGCI